MPWTFEFAPKARKEFDKLPPDAQTLIARYLKKRIAPLNDPRDIGERMVGYDREYWRFRINKYRIITEIMDDRLLISILRVAKRDAVYKNRL